MFEMAKMQKMYLLLVVPLIFVLTACAPQASAGSGTTTDPAAQTNGQQSAQGTPQPNGGFGANMTVEDKLAMGTLKLEGTDKAVTAEQAKTLLPLWKAVKSMSSSDTTSAEELAAVYQQIQDSMTVEQVQAIKDLNMTPTDQQALMAQYGVEGPQASGTRPSSTRTANNSTGGGQGGGPGAGQGGGPGGGGFMPPDGGGRPDGAMPGGQNASGTPQAGMPNRPRVGGMNQMFMAPLITLLQERAGA
jgi:hypothetical protein